MCNFLANCFYERQIYQVAYSSFSDVGLDAFETGLY